MISTALPFVLRLSKDERKVFQQNRILLFVNRKRAFAKENSGDSTLSELQPVPSITARIIMIDLSVPFPATDQWKARESLR